jgi:hypothetical protein
LRRRATWNRDHNRFAVVSGQYGAIKALTTRGAWMVSMTAKKSLDCAV